MPASPDSGTEQPADSGAPQTPDSGPATPADSGSPTLQDAGIDAGVWTKPTTGFVTNQRIQYTDGLHNENTDLIRWHDKVYLVFRGGEVSQIGSPKAHLNVWESVDAGDTWQKVAQIFMPQRDIRDPKFVIEGDKLVIYAITRIPGIHIRDAGGLALTVRTESVDGHAFSAPEPIYDQTWGFWRYTWHGQMLYATGYNDGDTQVGLFSSADGLSWQKVSLIYDSAADVPSEAELEFFGETAVSLVRLDNGTSLLSGGETAVCVAPPPYATWDCSRKLNERLDGPRWFSNSGHQYVVAREGLSGSRKRTAVYELLGDLATPSSPVSFNVLAELKSSGDTAYTGVIPLSGSQYLVSWYSSNVQTDPPWLIGILSPSDIWLTWLDFSKLGQ